MWMNQTKGAITGRTARWLGIKKVISTAGEALLLRKDQAQVATVTLLHLVARYTFISEPIDDKWSDRSYNFSSVAFLTFR